MWELLSLSSDKLASRDVGKRMAETNFRIFPQPVEGHVDQTALTTRFCNGGQSPIRASS
jgi:hypothetical protein